MMIEDAQGNLLEADAEALVNTVNCVGFMGKGIALQFKQAWPENFVAYQRAVRAGDVVPGKMFLYDTSRLVNPRYIINFPTKRHWRGRSRVEDIRSGLKALIADVERLGIRSIAVPPLGCGNGGLDWNVVRPLILKAFEALPEVRVFLYAPVGSPHPKQMPVGTTRPNMTPARALLLKLIHEYLIGTYGLTLLEIQKLAYFLQVSGEPLKLRYEGGHYGPYATNLNKVLERLEGHFIRGLGDDAKPEREIELLPGAIEAADAFLSHEHVPTERLDRVSRLISGFETPYGLELLSSVHWLGTHPAPRQDVQEVVQAMHAWNDRKRSLFRDDHMKVAWEHLREHGALEASAPESDSNLSTS